MSADVCALGGWTLEIATCIARPTVPVAGAGAGTPTGCRALKVMLPSPAVTATCAGLTAACAVPPLKYSLAGSPTT